MQSFRAVNETNGHVQTEYERDLYSQLSQATRESAERERAASHVPANGTTYESAANSTAAPVISAKHEADDLAKLEHDEPVRVYTAGSDPIPADVSPTSHTMQIDSAPPPRARTPSQPPPPPSQKQEQEPPAKEVPYERAPSTEKIGGMPQYSQNDINGIGVAEAATEMKQPQMPSPPLSGVREHAAGEGVGA